MIRFGLYCQCKDADTAWSSIIGQLACHSFRIALPDLSEATLTLLEGWEGSGGDPPWAVGLYHLPTNQRLPVSGAEATGDVVTLAHIAVR
jgi:hypothetical protein